MNIESHNKKTNHKVEIMAGLVLVMFVSWGCISQLQSPGNCKQAKEAWQKKHQATANSEQVDQVMVSRDTIHLCF